MTLSILEYTGIRSLGISLEAMKRYLVPQVKTRSGIKFGAVFSEDCTKVLNTDGSYFFEGDYDPNLGLFGQKACTPGSPVIIVVSDLEALKLASLGYTNTVCLAEPRMDDPLCFDILADNLTTITDTLLVWGSSSFTKRHKALEKFLLHVASRFTVLGMTGTHDCPILNTTVSQLQTILDLPRTKYEAWKPKGITFPRDIMNRPNFKEALIGVNTGFDSVNEHCGGFRRGETVMLTAGSGVGKTTIVQEMAFEMGMVGNIKVGMIFLEEKDKKTLYRLASIMYNVPVKEINKNPEILSPKQWEAFYNHPKINENFVFHDHTGSLDTGELFTKILYMIDYCHCEFIFLDHITMVVSGMVSSKEGERKDIDILMTKLSTMGVQKNVGFICITHLSVPEGSPHEEGGRVTLSQLRGSGSIKQLSFTILAQERNQQDPDSTRALLRCLKCRETGYTGPLSVLNYELNTGRLKEDKTWDPLEFERQLQPRRGGNNRGGGPPPPINNDKFRNTKFEGNY